MIFIQNRFFILEKKYRLSIMLGLYGIDIIVLIIFGNTMDEEGNGNTFLAFLWFIILIFAIIFSALYVKSVKNDKVVAQEKADAERIQRLKENQRKQQATSMQTKDAKPEHISQVVIKSVVKPVVNSVVEPTVNPIVNNTKPKNSTNNDCNEYIVIDVETPNLMNNSVCSFAYLHVKDGIIINKVYELINPQSRFDKKNIEVNGITDELVKGKMTLDVFWNEHKDEILSLPIVGHNIKFDISVITKALYAYHISIPEVTIYCTQKLSQKYLDISNSKLESICEYMNVELINHHNAMNDTVACYQVFNKLQLDNKVKKYDSDIYSFDLSEYEQNTTIGIKAFYSDNTKSMQQLKDIISSIMEDKIIEKIEVERLSKWLLQNQDLVGNYPFDKINHIVEDYIFDGVIDDNEKIELFKAFNDFLNPVNDKAENVTIIIEKSVFCLTGDFNYGSKEMVEDAIAKKGGILSKNLTMKVNYLVVGSKGSDAWKFGNYGGKVQKAKEYNEKGKNINLIEEKELVSIL